ncbi:MAG: hypothetical protein HKN79_03890 [Flavobacteriales bacterium]|nr:hypothetical protein [Flavobacteriales bacterium]
MKAFEHISMGLLMLLAAMDVSAQCAMCRAVLESDAAMEGVRVSEGINNGILYLMGFPYLLMFAVAFYIVRKEIRRSKLSI